MGGRWELPLESQTSRPTALMRKLHGLLLISKGSMVVVLCNDGEIEVPDGEICQICGQELEEFDEVTGTGIHGYYHWICVSHYDP